MINEPYILFLADAKSPQDAKTAFGIFQWRKDKCLSQYRYTDSTIKLDLPEYSFHEAVRKGAKTFILGVANQGGIISKTWIKTIIEAINAGLDVASGMHIKINDIPEIVSAAQKNNVKLHDVRYYDKTIPVGTGKKRSGKRILTVGTDCSVGKMYAALAIEKEMLSRGYSCNFKATGQTGILIAGGGIPVDAVISDFISGSVETLSPDNNQHHFDIIEGQGSLLHPSYAGVSLGILHGAQPDYLILCHDPSRTHIRHLKHIKSPSIEETITQNLDAVKVTNKNAKFIGICLNLSHISDINEQLKIKSDIENKYNLPVCDPIKDGTAIIIDQITP